MWMDADGDEEELGYDWHVPGDEVPRPPNDGACRRRRFFILLAGVLALAVCVWLFPGGHPQSVNVAATTRVSAVANASALPSGAATTPRPSATAPRLPNAKKAKTTAKKTTASVNPSSTVAVGVVASSPATTQPDTSTGPSYGRGNGRGFASRHWQARGHWRTPHGRFGRW